MTRFEDWDPPLHPMQGGPTLLRGIEMHLDFRYDVVVTHGRAMFTHCSHLANLAHARCGGKIPALILTDNANEMEGEFSTDTHYYIVVNLRRYIAESTGDPAVSYLARRTDVYNAGVARVQDLLSVPGVLDEVLNAELVADWFTIDPTRSVDVQNALNSEREIPQITPVQMVAAFSRYWRVLADHPELLDAVFSDEEMGASEAFARWVADHPSEAARVLQAFKEGDLAALDAAAGVARLRRFLSEWELNRANSTEEDWQQILTRESWVLGQLFGAPFVIVRGKAYVGGKTFENLEGRVTDFLYRNLVTGNVLIIEIKTPVAPLLAAQYRGQVFPPSGELSGAITQVLDQRRLLLAEPALNLEAADVASFHPRSVVLIGDIESQGIEGDRLRSFELFRNELAGVEVVTFDELAAKADALLELFRRTDGGDQLED
jgi:hypothetical protein